jgi:hypothetical protein
VNYKDCRRTIIRFKVLRKALVRSETDQYHYNSTGDQRTPAPLGAAKNNEFQNPTEAREFVVKQTARNFTKT